MALGRGDIIEADVAVRIETNGAPPTKNDRLLRVGVGDDRLRAVGIDRIRPFPAEAEDHGLVRRVAFAGEGERAVERDDDAFDALNRAASRQSIGESRRRLHRPNGVRGRGPDADLEQFEDPDQTPLSRFMSSAQLLIARRRLEDGGDIGSERASGLDAESLRLAAPQHDLGLEQQRARDRADGKGGQIEVQAERPR